MRTLVALLLLVTAATAAHADHDSEPRTNLELGFEASLRGNAPLGGYAFLHWNRPHFAEEDLYLRVDVAPVYLDTELISDGWPWKGHAIGLGARGGLFASNFDEFRNGDHKERESFWGHDVGLSFTYYRHRLIAYILPIEAQIRFRPEYVIYQRSGDTDPRFQLPADTFTPSARVGVRIGGVPPELLPNVAIELSIWYEAKYRHDTEAYGLPGSLQDTQQLTERAWARAGGIATILKTHTVQVFLTAGTADADALSTFRMGGALPWRREVPLILHGYPTDAIFADRFWLINASYRFPLWPGSDRLHMQLAADYAQVDDTAGHRLPRRELRGLGADLTIAITRKVTLVLGYGYGLDAPHGSSFGGHEVTSLLEVKF